MKANVLTKTAVAICLAGAIALPSLAEARSLTLNTQLQSYRGNAAYLAFYVTDANGQYQSTLWVAGKKAKYYKHLRDWNRGRSADSSALDGTTGASVGSGDNLTVTVELADALLDAGYEIRVDSAVEDKRDNRADIRVPLTTEGAGKVSTGSGYIESFSYDL
jgi:hypothetical protein